MPPFPNNNPQHTRSGSQTFSQQSADISSNLRPRITSSSTSTTTTISAGGYGASGTSTSSGAASSISSMSTAKSRQYTHLHSQLAQLNAHLADTENLVRMTAVQAGDMRFLGGYIGGLFMGAAKILGEEGINKSGAVPTGTKDGSGDDETTPAVTASTTAATVGPAATTSYSING